MDIEKYLPIACLCVDNERDTDEVRWVNEGFITRLSFPDMKEMKIL